MLLHLLLLVWFCKLFFFVGVVEHDAMFCAICHAFKAGCLCMFGHWGPVAFGFVFFVGQWNASQTGVYSNRFGVGVSTA